MTDPTTPRKVVDALGHAGKRTAHGAGVVGKGLFTVLAAAGQIQRRDEVRKKLECLDYYELEIAMELIEERIANRR